ncbi:hypothetical protein BDV93DRAFT_587194 [Ceratobasidium sp. AG-I]|nr:hypothetical protein BDV93DRAFT_587194 [Ceratobasidium sp. AG-I]
MPIKSKASLYRETDSARQLWEIVPAAASAQTTGSFMSPITQFAQLSILADGCYRVRNLNPSCVLTLSASGLSNKFAPDTVYVEQQDNSLRQAWDFIKQDNGYYAIRSHDTNKYLSYSTVDPRYPLIKVQEQPADWQLENVGGFGYILAVPNTAFAVGFADYRADPTDKITLVDNIVGVGAPLKTSLHNDLAVKDDVYQPALPVGNFREQVSPMFANQRPQVETRNSTGWAFKGE